MSRARRPRRNRLRLASRSRALRPLGLESLECRRLLAADINLVGNGVSIVNNDVTPSAADFTDFGNVQITGAPLTRTFTVQNTGDEALTLNGASLVAISGANASDFSVVAQPASSINAAASTTFQLRFTPSGAGTRSATITIASTDPDENPYIFAVQGAGVQPPDIAITDLDLTNIVSGDTTPSAAESTEFGTVNTSNGTRVQTFALSNIGAGVLNLTGTPRVQITGPNAAEFTVISQPTATLNSQTQQTFSISFDPSANGLRTATVTIASDDPDESPFTFAIQGTGANVPSIRLTNLALANIANGDTTPSVADSTDFGTVNTASGTRTQTFAINNLGLGTLNLTGTPRVVVGGANASDFTVTVQPPASVAAGTNQTFTVSFDPSADGVRRATLSIANDDGTASPFTFDIQGTGAVVAQTGKIALSNFTGTVINSGDTTPSTADSTDFGSVDTAAGQRDQTFVISNFGPGALNLTGSPRVSIGGTNAGDFSVVTQPSSPLAANTNNTFAIRFNPSATGLRTATVTIANDDPTAPSYTFAIQGTGSSLPEISLSSFVGAVDIANGDTTPGVGDGTDFGNADVNAGLRNQRFVISNLGSATLNLNGSTRIAIGGANASDFTVVSTPSATVAAGTNQTFEIQFNPSATGTRTATVTIANDDSDEGTFTFTIQGAGVTLPEIALGSNAGVAIASGDTTPSTADLTDFGNVDVLSETKDQRFAITNFGGATLNLTGTPRVQISGAHASDFTIVSQPPASLASNANVALDVRFNPSAVGTRTATITISSDDADEGTYTFAIQGTGATAVNRQIAVTTASGANVTNGAQNVSNFGEVTLYSGTSTTQYAITNFGTGPLSLSGSPRVTISGPHASDFLVTRQPANSIDVNGSTTFNISFTPIGIGDRRATISFATSDTDENPFTFTVRGTGTTFQMANVQVTDGAGNLILDGDTTPSADNQTSFGSVNVGSSLARTYTLENEGARSLEVAGVTISGANAADFSVTQQPVSSLGKNSTSNFIVTFRPSATGARNATVTITTSGAAKNTFTFDISGNGTSAAASATDAALSSLV